jgi:NodT family efflux transporter outer membrane factor (OMF) lipoprotein
MRRHAIVAAIAAVLAACTVGPEYRRPEVATPETYRGAGGDWKRAQPADGLPRGSWWEMFGDPQLNALAQRVEVSNQGIRAAEARFRQAQTLVRQARAELFPVIAGSAAASRSRSPGSPARTASSYDLALDAAWEPDLWGRVRRSVEASAADWQGSAADLESVRLSALATLAQNYIALRTVDTQVQLLKDTVAAFQRSLDLTRNRYAVGVAAKADVVLAEVQLKSGQAELAELGVQRAQLEHAIALLVGEPASTFSLAPAPLKAAMPKIPVGVPTELLERRPDIAAAERRVAAANARIGVAESAFYPSLTLSGTGGFSNARFADLIAAPSRFWALGATFAQLLFDGGAREAVTDQARAAHDEEVALYRQSVLTGFQEVEDNLAALKILEEEALLQDAVVRGARQSVEFALNQYKAGTVNFLNVIVLQAAALNHERAAVNLLGRRLTASVLLVKALGGGWDAAALNRLGRATVGTEAPKP